MQKTSTKNTWKRAFEKPMLDASQRIKTQIRWNHRYDFLDARSRPFGAMMRSMFPLSRVADTRASTRHRKGTVVDQFSHFMQGNDTGRTPWDPATGRRKGSGKNAFEGRYTRALVRRWSSDEVFTVSTGDAFNQVIVDMERCVRSSWARWEASTTVASNFVADQCFFVNPRHRRHISDHRGGLWHVPTRLRVPVYLYHLLLEKVLVQNQEQRSAEVVTLLHRKLIGVSSGRNNSLAFVLGLTREALLRFAVMYCDIAMPNAALEVTISIALSEAWFSCSAPERLVVLRSVAHIALMRHRALCGTEDLWTSTGSCSVATASDRESALVLTATTIGTFVQEHVPFLVERVWEGLPMIVKFFHRRHLFGDVLDALYLAWSFSGCGVPNSESMMRNHVSTSAQLRRYAFFRFECKLDEKFLQTFASLKRKRCGDQHDFMDHLPVAFCSQVHCNRSRVNYFGQKLLCGRRVGADGSLPDDVPSEALAQPLTAEDTEAWERAAWVLSSILQPLNDAALSCGGLQSLEANPSSGLILRPS